MWDEHDDYSEVDGTRTEEKEGRWMLYCSAVFLQKSTGDHYQLCWGAGATEMQYTEPYEYEEETTALQVELKEKVVKVWSSV